MNQELSTGEFMFREINNIKFDRPDINIENIISQVARFLMEYQALHINNLKSLCYTIFLSHTDYSMYNPYKEDNPHEELETLFYRALIILKRNTVLQGITKNGWVFQTNSIGTNDKQQMKIEELTSYIYSF